MNSKLKQLEALRGFASIYVFAGHFLLSRVLDKSSHIGFLLRFGQEAVIIFFVISGFVIYFSTEKPKEANFRRYITRRSRRIYPIYLLALLVSWIVSSDFGEQLRLTNLTQIIGNLLMFQDFSYAKPGVLVTPLYGNESLWSLSYEWWFYMMFFPIHKYIPSRNQIHIVALLSFIGFISYQTMPNQISLFLMYFILWWSGVELAKDYLSQNRLLSFRSQHITLKYLALFVLLLGLPVTISLHKREQLFFGIHPVLEFRHFLACLMLIALGLIWRTFNWKYFKIIFGAFALVSPISYALYVFHYPVAVSSNFLSWIPNQGIQLILYVSITILIAIVAEIPFQKLVNSLIKIPKN